MRQRVVVVGAGVSGLSSAILLAEDPARRFEVEVVAERIGREAMSHVAAALFYPYAAEHPHLERWLLDGLAIFRALAEVPGTGIRIAPGVEARTTAVGVAPWRGTVLGYRHGLPKAPERDPRYVGGHHFSVPVIEMPVYLDYLVERFRRTGSPLRRATLDGLDDVCAPDVIVVHASGVRARALVPDPTVLPSLGQVVRIPRGDIHAFAMDDEDPRCPTYVVPRSNDCILGSVDVPWPADELGYEPPPARPEVTAAILERCARLDRRVRDADVLESYCGLRPRRPAVRVEVDQERLARGQRVVHDYGHGGSGVTLSWGAARDVLARVAELAGGGRVTGAPAPHSGVPWR